MNVLHFKNSYSSVEVSFILYNYNAILWFLLPLKMTIKIMQQGNETHLSKNKKKKRRASQV